SSRHAPTNASRSSRIKRPHPPRYTMTDSTQDTAPEPTPEPTLRSIVGSLAGAIDNDLSNVELAELRRISPQQPYSSTLWKLLLAYVPESRTSGPEQDLRERRWATLLMGLTHCKGLHAPKIPLGQALAEVGWSELRFVRLMQARGEGLELELRR